MKKIIPGFLMLLALSHNSGAAIVYESATGPFNSTVCCGSFTNESQFIGATFTLTQMTHIDGLGGHFNTFGGTGSVFGALVSLNDTGTPTGTLTNLQNVIAYSVFTPNSGTDTVSAVDVTLSAGKYGLVFGSGLYGATGGSTLTLLQPYQAYTSSGSIVSLNTSSVPDWGFSTDATNRYRLFVTGTPQVPLPSAIWLLGSGLAGLAGVAAKRKSA